MNTEAAFAKSDREQAIHGQGYLARVRQSVAVAEGEAKESCINQFLRILIRTIGFRKKSRPLP